MTTDEDENLLVLLVQTGDTAAFEKLLPRLYDQLRAYVVKLVGGSLADDVLQEVALRVFQNIKHLRETRAFRPWAYRIATRLAFACLRHEARSKLYKANFHEMSSTSPCQWTNENEPESELLSMVDRLSPASRAVLLLHYQQNLSIEESAAILDIPVGTAKSRLAYGIRKLRDFIKEKNEYDHCRSRAT